MGDVDASSFSKALQRATGVLLILDKNATPFDRIWCCFELFQTVHAGKPLDIVSSFDQSGARATCVLTSEELPGESVAAKVARDMKFPFQLLVKGMRSNLDDGQASVERDKERILDFIEGVVHLKQAETSRLAQANATLHAQIAL